MEKSLKRKPWKTLTEKSVPRNSPLTRYFFYTSVQTVAISIYYLSSNGFTLRSPNIVYIVSIYIYGHSCIGFYCTSSSPNYFLLLRFDFQNKYELCENTSKIMHEFIEPEKYLSHTYFCY